jgi:hypothetical protein
MSIAKQGTQLHLLLQRGFQIWEKIFPGIGICESIVGIEVRRGGV